MTASASDRPPYLAALAVVLAVLAGYVLTLAPSVTFWDAGEFIAAARILGIPHPPGTPLFVLLGHVWGMLLPIGEYAFRLNLMSATFSAVGAGFLFLVAHEALRGLGEGLAEGPARLLRIGGAAAGAMIAAFTFTQWQNSVETEVYAVATCTIAAMCWLALRWRAARGGVRAAAPLLLVIYLGGVSMGNHLLALLAGPAVIAFVGATLMASPATAEADRRREWAELGVLAGIWALLIGTGLGSTPLIVVGALCFAGVAAWAVGAGAGRFALAALGLAAVGVTIYLFLYLRAAQQPMLNEADPSTFDALLAVIRRAQYPPRTPFDDPTVPHGPDNPGRTLTLIGLQLLNYVQYFDWQWLKALPGGLPLGDGAFPFRTIGTLVFAGFGLRGLVTLRRLDRGAFWLLLALFLITGLGLVGYMNFKPGYSLAYHLYPSTEDHEVRERDYFFVMSFVIWGVLAGMGLAAAARRVLDRGRPWARAAAVGILVAGTLVPVAGNAAAASRRHGADHRLAADFAYSLLNSVPPYGVLFTYGDNDTFPLWWAQEVEGIRRDVTVVCLALANTDWYMRQLRDQPTRAFDSAGAPAVWREQPVPARPDWPLHTMTDAEIAAAFPQRLANAISVRFGPITRTLPAGTILMTNDFPSIRIVQQNIGRRPIAWSITAGREFLGLDDYVVQEGLVFRLRTVPADSTDLRLDDSRLAGSLLDVALTDRLVWETYRYGGLLEGDAARLESTSRMFASTFSLPATQLAYAYEARGDLAATQRNLERAAALSPNPGLRAALDQLRLRTLGDSGYALPR